MIYPPVQYHDYLQLDKILTAQKLRSEEYQNKAHDEMLFITVHQVFELWFKQILFELDSILAIFNQDRVEEDQMLSVNLRLDRITEIQKLFSTQIDVLETMTPLDFLDFRNYLYPASGFQSYQFRLVETKLGLKIDDRLKYNDQPFYKSLNAQQQQDIQNILKQKSLFDHIEKWLERTPYLQIGEFDFWKEYSQACENMLLQDIQILKNNPLVSESNKTMGIKMLEQELINFKSLFDQKKYQELQQQGYFRMSFEAIQAALFIQVYRHKPELQQAYRLLQLIQNIDENFTSWRYRHALMAHRMLGKKIGTGGSSGHEYLKNATERHKIFSDLFNLTTFFIPKNKIPNLPKNLSQSL